jgi:hypothetical protein
MPVPIVYTNLAAPAIDAGNLNTVNNVVYTVLGDGTNAPSTALDVRTNIGLGVFATLASPAPVANGGTGDTGTAWATQAVTATPSSGSMTAPANIRWKTIGKTAFFTITVTISALGTASGAVLISGLPFVFAGNTGIAVGRENGVAGAMLQGICLAGSSTVNILRYDNLSPLVAFGILVVTGVGEIA